MADDPTLQPEPVPQPKSRSQLKREAQAIAAIGEELERLPKKGLDQIPLPDPLRAAVDELRSTKAHGAHKRQLGYVGRLLRAADLEPINAALDRVLDRGKAGSIAARKQELWRDRILSEGDAAIEAFIADHPDADRQRLRQYYRTSRKAGAGTDRQTRVARELLTYVRGVASAV